MGDDYQDPDVCATWCKERGLPYIYEIYRGPFDIEKIKSLITGNSKFCPTQRIMEGCVIKPVKETKCYMGRKVLKLINDEYLAAKEKHIEKIESNGQVYTEDYAH